MAACVRARVARYVGVEATSSAHTLLSHNARNVLRKLGARRSGDAAGLLGTNP